MVVAIVMVVGSNSGDGDRAVVILMVAVIVGGSGDSKVAMSNKRSNAEQHTLAEIIFIKLHQQTNIHTNGLQNY